MKRKSLCHWINPSTPVLPILSPPSLWWGYDRTGKDLEKDDNDSRRQRRTLLPVEAGRLGFSAKRKDYQTKRLCWKTSGIEGLRLFNDPSSKRTRRHQGARFKTNKKKTDCGCHAEVRWETPICQILQILKVLHKFRKTPQILLSAPWHPVLAEGMMS